jgi:hypothetical protein
MTEQLNSGAEVYSVQKLLRTVAFGREHADAVRQLLDPRLKLVKTAADRGNNWKNVPEHCLTAAMLHDTLAEAMELPAEQRKRTADVLIMHDADKHLQIRPKDFPGADAGDAEAAFGAFMQEADPDGALRRALQEDNRGLEALPPEALIPRLVDNMCMESTVAPYRERLDEVRRRRESRGQDLRQIYGDDYWEREDALTRAAADACARVLRGKGHDVPDGDALPGFLIRRIVRGIQGGPSPLDGWKAGGTEMLSPRFYAQTVLDTPRPDAQKNEDRGWSMITKDKAVLIVHDGATGITVPPVFEALGQSPGWIAADEGLRGGKSYIDAVIRDPQKRIDPVETMLAMNGAIDHKARALQVDKAEQDRVFSTCALTASVTAAGPGLYDLDYAGAGDCALLVLHADGTVTWLELGQGEEGEIRENNVAWAEVLERRALEPGASMRDVIADLERYPRTLEVINANRMAENTSAAGGASLKGSDPEQLRRCMHVSAKSVRLRSSDTVVALTDGALPWVKVPMEQRKAFVEEALQAGGPAELLARRKALGDANPDCDNPPCFKQWDDATVSAVRLL